MAAATKPNASPRWWLVSGVGNEAVRETHRRSATMRQSLTPWSAASGMQSIVRTSTHQLDRHRHRLGGEMMTSGSSPWWRAESVLARAMPGITRSSGACEVGSCSVALSGDGLLLPVRVEQTADWLAIVAPPHLTFEWRLNGPRSATKMGG